MRPTPREMYAYKVHAYGGVLRGPSASEHHHTSVPAPGKDSALSHMVFSRRRNVLRPLFRTPHGLLGYQLIGLFRPVCLSPVCLSLSCRSDCCASFPRLTHPPRLQAPAASGDIKTLAALTLRLARAGRVSLTMLTYPHPPSTTAVRSTNRLRLRGPISGPWPA
jgi:hypothetical protein